MTLTLTLAGDGFIVQSADHRLVGVPTKQVVDESERKQLLVQLGDGAAAVCFSGVGFTSTGRRASQVLYEAALNAGPPFETSFDAVAESIRSASESWLRGVRYGHSFVMSGFESTDDAILTRVAMISNYQRLQGEMNEHGREAPVVVDAELTAGRFVISSVEVTEPVVLVAGMHPAVTIAERQRLTRAMRKRRLSSQLARSLAYVNATASIREAAKRGISADCTTISLVVGRRQINGMTRAHGDREIEVVTEIVQPGNDMRAILQTAIEQIWREQGLSGTPIQRASSTLAIPLRRETRGSPYMRADEPLGH
jgi:hypothetical protein